MADNDKLTRNGGNTPEQLERRPVVAPAVDIYENKDEILVVADVPGAHSDRVTVRLEKDELFLHARRQTETTEKSEQADKGGKPGAHPVFGRSTAADYSRTFIVPT